MDSYVHFIINYVSRCRDLTPQITVPWTDIPTYPTTTTQHHKLHVQRACFSSFLLISRSIRFPG